MYEDIIEDKVLAHMWWNIAALQGHENARQNRDNIEERMPLQHIEEAQNLSRECVENNFKECGEQKSWWKVWD